MPAGRPSSYTDEIADAICERLAGGESLRTICADEAMPGLATVIRWREREEFERRYVRAREVQADTLADESQDIADDGRNDWMERFGKDGESLGWQLNGEHVQRSKLRIEQRRWYAAKLLPKRYGDKQQVDHTSSDGSMTPADATEKLAQLMAQVRERT